MDCETKIKDITGKVMKAMEVFSICIRHLKKQLLSEMNKRFANEVSEKDIHYVLTVPGIWKDAARRFMRKAATQVRFKIFNPCNIIMVRRFNKLKNNYPILPPRL